jgi:hypothetical protein
MPSYGSTGGFGTPGQATALKVAHLNKACSSYVCNACVNAAPTRLRKFGAVTGLANWQQSFVEMQRCVTFPAPLRGSGDSEGDLEPVSTTMACAWCHTTNILTDTAGPVQRSAAGAC